MPNVLRAIRKKFGVRIQGDCMPVACRNGTRNQLADLWGELGYTTGVEIGVMRGHFSEQLLDRIPECNLTCVDLWSTYGFSHRTDESQLANFKAATERLKDRATILRMVSMDALVQFEDSSLDFVFIDGDHTFDFCMMDIICYSRKVKTGGMVAVHDYLPMRRGGVMKAVEAYTHCHNIHPWFVTREHKYPTAFWVKEGEE